MLIKTFYWRPVFYSISLLLLLLATVYYFPRYLVDVFGEKSPWTSYLYTYGMGNIFFLLTVFWIFTRKKSALRKKQELFWLTLVLAGLIFTFTANGLWILFSIHYPVKF